MLSIKKSQVHVNKKLTSELKDLTASIFQMKYLFTRHNNVKQ